MSQERVQKKPQPRDSKGRYASQQDAEVKAAQEKPQADTSDMDAVLDEIDALLEEVGFDTAINFRQRGGE